jgi:hypothetical protein
MRARCCTHARYFMLRGWWLSVGLLLVCRSAGVSAPLNQVDGTRSVPLMSRVNTHEAETWWIFRRLR